jgi:hypothetical protein
VGRGTSWPFGSVSYACEALVGGGSLPGSQSSQIGVVVTVVIVLGVEWIGGGQRGGEGSYESEAIRRL